VALLFEICLTIGNIAKLKGCQYSSLTFDITISVTRYAISEHHFQPCAEVNFHQPALPCLFRISSELPVTKQTNADKTNTNTNIAIESSIIQCGEKVDLSA
jgi:hypothetical protein